MQKKGRVSTLQKKGESRALQKQGRVSTLQKKGESTPETQQNFQCFPLHTEGFCGSHYLLRMPGR